MSKFTSIPQPTEKNLLTVVEALKEAVEVLVRQRGDIGNSSVTWDELLALKTEEGKTLVDPASKPRKHGT